MSKSMINVRTNEQTKELSELIFRELGLNMTTAVNLFLEAVIRENGIPFSLTLTPNAETKTAFREGDRALETGNYEVFESTEDLWEDLGI